MDTVRQVFEKAYGEIPADASCHIGEYFGPYYAVKRGHLYRWERNLGWERAMLYSTIGPDIADRDGFTFRGFFGQEYDKALDELVSEKKTNQNKLIQYVNWYAVSLTYNLDEDFMREFQEHLDWEVVSARTVLSEDFIREMKDRVNWNEIIKNQTLSMDFLREMKDYVNWTWIASWQQLSEDFIIEFQDRVIWSFVNKYQKLSDEFREQYKDKLHPK